MTLSPHNLRALKQLHLEPNSAAPLSSTLPLCFAHPLAVGVRRFIGPQDALTRWSYGVPDEYQARHRGRGRGTRAAGSLGQCRMRRQRVSKPRPAIRIPPACAEQTARACMPRSSPPPTHELQKAPTRLEEHECLIAPLCRASDMCNRSSDSAPTISWATSSNRLYIDAGCATMADIYAERSDNEGPKGPLYYFDQVLVWF